MTPRQLTWVIATGLIAVLIAGAVDAVRSSEPGSSPSPMVTTERSAVREMTIPVATRPVALPRCTVQNIGVSIDVLGGTATVVVRHVGGRPCQLAPPLPVRLSMTDRVGRRVRLATVGGGHDLRSRVAGDFSPGFEQLIDIPYLAEPTVDEGCDRRGPFTAFVIVGPYSAQRKLSGSEVGCFRGG